ncbi:MAG TPA: patatin-like phospholipase family protein [Archangium sp.]
MAATRVSDGRTALFVQHAKKARQWWFENPHFEVIQTLIGPRHALASAAMPLIFAPVEIENQLYLDGGIRMMVPVSPALHFGAQRVIVISLQPQTSFAITSPEEPLLPTAAFLAGKAMNSLLQDRIDQDVENLRRINALIEAGYDAFGRPFSPAMNAALARQQHAPVRYVRNMLVRPSRDIGSIANRFLHDRSFFRRHQRLPAKILSLIAGRESESGSDLASFLLFDPNFAEELIALGRADARRHAEEWARFFDDTPLNDAEAAELARETKEGPSVTDEGALQ